MYIFRYGTCKICNLKCVPTEQLQASQQECAHLRAAAEDARAGSVKLEKDMEGLSGAYNALEAHCSALEARLREAEAQSGQISAAGAHAMLPSRAWYLQLKFWLISLCHPW